MTAPSTGYEIAVRMGFPGIVTVQTTPASVWLSAIKPNAPTETGVLPQATLCMPFRQKNPSKRRFDNVDLLPSTDPSVDPEGIKEIRGLIEIGVPARDRTHLDEQREDVQACGLHPVGMLNPLETTPGVSHTLNPRLIAKVLSGQKNPSRRRFYLTRPPLLHTPRSMLHAPRSMLHAPCSTLHAPCSTLHAPCSTLHAPRSMLHAPCSMLHAHTQDA